MTQNPKESRGQRDGVVEKNNKERKNGAKMQRGAGGQKACECGKGAREAEWEGHRRGREA
eukprot:2516701-Pleurochrysis_carterae.AAC.1